MWSWASASTWRWDSGCASASSPPAHRADDLHSLTRITCRRAAHWSPAVLNHGVGAMQQFARQGFAPLLEEYLAADTLRDRHGDPEWRSPVADAGHRPRRGRGRRAAGRARWRNPSHHVRRSLGEGGLIVMNTLLVDIGQHTHQVGAAARQRRWVDKRRCPSATGAAFERALRRLRRVDSVLVVSVAGARAELRVARRPAATWLAQAAIRAQQRAAGRCHQWLSRMRGDWAPIAGWRRSAPGIWPGRRAVCAVSVGTALTIDVVDARRATSRRTHRPGSGADGALAAARHAGHRAARRGRLRKSAASPRPGNHPATGRQHARCHRAGQPHCGRRA